DAEGHPVEVKMRSKGEGLYQCSYTPTSSLKHTVSVTWGGVSVPNSPFRVSSQSQLLVSTGRDVSVGIKWDSSAVGEQEADVDFDIIPNANDTFTVKYVPPAAGRLTVKVLFTDESPFMVKVEPSHDASKVKAKGPGLAPTGVESGKPTHFTVVSKGAGKAPLDVSFSSSVKDFDIIDNYDYSHTVKYTPVQQPGKADVSLVRYTPKEEGIYTVNVSYDGHPVPGSPFPVEAQLPPDPSKVKAFGPGLKGGLVANPAEFTIDTKGAGTGGLGLTVEGPTEAKIECSDNGDGTCSVSYLPTEPGDYLVNILFENVHIPGSPFRADIQMPFDPSKVVASGSGLKKAKTVLPKYVVTFFIYYFAVCCRHESKDGGCGQQGRDLHSDLRPPELWHVHPDAEVWRVNVLYDDTPVPRSPFRVSVTEGCDPSRVVTNLLSR
ncbi:hypothetical protein XENOCAPTIV_028614, partial [Xenoophorus captivus]